MIDKITTNSFSTINSDYQKPKDNTWSFLYENNDNQSEYNYAKGIQGDLYGIVKPYNCTQIDTPQTQDDIKNILTITEIIEKSLTEKFPEGFKIIGIGRSPSLIIELLKAKGYDAKSCPISNLSNGEYDITGQYGYLKQLNTDDIKEFNKYLQSIGITKEKINSSKQPTIFVDYTRTGESLRSFKNLLARKEIGINSNDNVKFLSLNKDLIPQDNMEYSKLIDKYWENLGIKNYSFMPRLDISNIGQINKIMDNYEPSQEAKNFLEKLKNS